MSPGTSTFHMSPGISISTGPGRPLRAKLKARRRAGISWSGVLMVSACLVMCWKFIVALKPGLTNAPLRPEPPGITTSGTPSE